MTAPYILRLMALLLPILVKKSKRVIFLCYRRNLTNHILLSEQPRLALAPQHQQLKQSKPLLSWIKQLWILKNVFLNMFLTGQGSQWTGQCIWLHLYAKMEMRKELKRHQRKEEIDKCACGCAEGRVWRKQRERPGRIIGCRWHQNERDFPLGADDCCAYCGEWGHWKWESLMRPRGPWEKLDEYH